MFESFVAMMRGINLELPAHLTEALRTNMNGGKPLCQLLAEAAGKIAVIIGSEGAEFLERALPRRGSGNSDGAAK